MSESSQDKTKRKYLDLLTGHPWSYQCSIFYQDSGDSVRLLEDMKGFKQALRRKCPDIPILVRVCLLNREKNLQAYLSILTPQKIKPEVEALSDKFSADVRVVGRRLRPEKVVAMATTIRNERPHNLNRFFNKPKINRYSVLNEGLLKAENRGDR